MTEIAETFRLASVENILMPRLQLKDSVLEHDGILVIESKSDRLQISRDQAELTVAHGIDDGYVKETINAFNDIVAVQWCDIPFTFPGRIEQIDVFLDDDSEGFLVENRESRKTPAIIGVAYKGSADTIIIYTDFDCVQLMTELDFQSHLQRNYPKIRIESLIVL